MRRALLFGPAGYALVRRIAGRTELANRVGRRVGDGRPIVGGAALEMRDRLGGEPLIFLEVTQRAVGPVQGPIPVDVRSPLEQRLVGLRATLLAERLEDGRLGLVALLADFRQQSLDRAIPGRRLDRTANHGRGEQSRGDHDERCEASHL